MASRKKWKNLSPLLQGVVYLGTRLVICLFQTLSHDLARTFITILTWIAYAVDRRHRLIGLENLRQAFPGRYSEAELDAMVFATYRHFFTLLIEVTQLPRKVHRQNTGNHFDLGRDEQTILSLLKSDRPLLIVTAHFGNWELAGYGLGTRGFSTYAVSRPLDNRYLESYMRGIREHMGQTMLAKKDLVGIQSALAGGGKLAVLADQYSGPRGQMVNFFGRPAATSKGVAILAHKIQRTLMVVGVRKVAEPMPIRSSLRMSFIPRNISTTGPPRFARSPSAIPKHSNGSSVRRRNNICGCIIGGKATAAPSTISPRAICRGPPQHSIKGHREQQQTAERFTYANDHLCPLSSLPIVHSWKPPLGPRVPTPTRCGMTRQPPTSVTFFGFAWWFEMFSALKTRAC